MPAKLRSWATKNQESYSQRPVPTAAAPVADEQGVAQFEVPRYAVAYQRGRQG